VAVDVDPSPEELSALVAEHWFALRRIVPVVAFARDATIVVNCKCPIRRADGTGVTYLRREAFRRNRRRHPPSSLGKRIRFPMPTVACHCPDGSAYANETTKPMRLARFASLRH